MKLKLQKTIYMLSRYFLYVLVLQMLVINLALAMDVHAQYKRIDEVLVKLDRMDLTLEQFFGFIEEKSDFQFSYDKQDIDGDFPIVLENKSATVEDYLRQVAAQASLSFRQVNNSIDIKKVERPFLNKPSSQDVTISGTVTDERGEPIPGATVSIAGTTTGTATGPKGDYSLSVPEGATLVFSFIGYATQRVTIGNQSILNIQMVPDLQALSEVVVTAFGIEKEKAAITYSSQEVDGDLVSRVNNPNFLNSLQGKVAGMTVRLPSGQPGSVPTIYIRGNRSISGTNAPIYVIDGQIINGSPQDLNPNDIENINVLKGPNASALYGMLAANGAIVITTKNGSELGIGKPVVSLETGYNVDQITRLPNTQKIFAQGQNGRFNAFSAYSWGPRIDTLGTYTNQLGEPEQARVYNNTEDFFVNDGTYNANLNVGKNFEGGNYNIGSGYVNQKGIVQGTDFERLNFKFSGSYDLSSKLSVGASVNSSFSRSEGVPPDGGSSYFYASFFTPPTYDMKNKPTHVPGEPYRQINFRSAHDNPYWSIKNNSDTEKNTRTFGNFFFSYRAFDWLNINYRIGNDYYIRTYKEVLSLGSGATGGRSNPPAGGRITDRTSKAQVLNSNLNATLSKDFGDFEVDFLFGGDLYNAQSEQLNAVGNNIIIGGFNNISNTTIQSVSQSESRRRIFGLYGNLDLGWKDAVYLSLTGRNDRVSNLPSANRAFFYPSVGLGVVFTEFLNVPEEAITFGKIRASYAESGQAGNIYVQDQVFTNSGVSHGRSAGNFIFPFNGINAFSQSNTLIAEDLEPENTVMSEVGFDIRLVNNRIGLDYTYFSSKTENQIFDVPVPYSTGFSVERRNSGAVSSYGHEIIFTAKPVVSGTFNWTLSANLTSYKNQVDRLAEGIERLSLGSVGAATVYLEEGRPYPIIRGTAYARDPQSDMMVVDSRRTLSNGAENPLYGMPLQANEPKELGTSVPDFEIGLLNHFSYNAVSLDVQIDWRQGGKLYSSFNRLGSLYGMTEETINREQGDEVILEAKKGFYDAEGSLIVEGDNDIPIIKGETFYTGMPNTINEPHVYDASFVRLREVRLSFDLPAAWTRSRFMDEASVYFVGRNLALKSNVPNHDPEESAAGGAAAGAGQHLTYPQIRSFGAGIQVKF